MKSLFFTYLFFCSSFAGILAQEILSGIVYDVQDNQAIYLAKVILNDSLVSQTNIDGTFIINASSLTAKSFSLQVLSLGYVPYSVTFDTAKDFSSLRIPMQLIVNELSSVDLLQQDHGDEGITRLRSVEGTAIYAAKKNEVILMNQSLGNKSTNNSRQVYARVPGLNFWESDGLGLQLEIGARGLSPQRTSNFNTRQNGYDISADALGYPESYYTPPTEAIDQIQIVRGAASLQYGTQFGGLLNFVLKTGPDKSLEAVLRHSIGSFGLRNTYLSLGGSKGNWRYYSFYQLKKRDGWRPNSKIDAQTAYFSAQCQVNDKLRLSYEFTHMDYVSQQPGGLDDVSFYFNPDTSFRSRNWFQVDWNVSAVHLDYQFTSRTQLNTRFFGLFSSRDALGILDSEYVPDSVVMILNPNRDLQTAVFANLGSETRLVHRYLLSDKESALLLGMRFYKGFTTKKQGNASGFSGADFSFENKLDYYGSEYDFPSYNSAFFAENLIRFNDKISFTPGFRFDRIVTEADGYFHAIVNDSLYYIDDYKRLDRNVYLFGVGLSFRLNSTKEVYANFSQNYRAINFNDMQVVNSNLVIDPLLKDENGFNIDFGFRGNHNTSIEFDLSLFYLNYSNRIGYLQQYYNPNNAPVPSLVWTSYRLSTNVGDSRTFGLESYISYTLFNRSKHKAIQSLNVFLNGSFQRGKYVSSDEVTIVGKEVELNPNINARIGIKFLHNRFSSSLLYSITSSQFSDAQNTILPSTNALFGEIPAYSVVDFSSKYSFREFALEFGINNLLDASYFTRRASGYPGPGIIPSDRRNFYCSFQYSL